MNNSLKDKRILLGVTGSIAAYKAPLLVRELIKNGAFVKVIMTPSAKEFVSPMVLSNLSHNEVIIDMFDNSNQTSGAWHIKYAHESDLMIIAPCSASTLAKIANGICDNALVTLAIALEPSIPLLISPAMDTTMWLHPATQRAVSTVQNDGAIIIPPAEGDLSSGLIGPGRMPETNDLVDQIGYTLYNWNYKKRYEQVSKVNNFFSTQKEEIKESTIDERTKDLIDSPINPIKNVIDKDKFNAELEFENLKKKMT